MSANAREMAMDFDGWAEKLPELQRNAVQAQLSRSPDPAAEKRKLSNIFWISERAGLPLRTVSENYDAMLASYSTRAGWGDAFTKDETFHARVLDEATREFNEGLMLYGEDGDNERAQSSRDASMHAAAYGAGTQWIEDGENAGIAFAKWQEAAKSSPSYRPENAAGYYFDWMQRYQEGVEDMRKAKAAAEAAFPILSGIETQGRQVSEAVPLFRDLTPTQRQLAIRGIQELAGKSTSDTEARGTAEQAAIAAGRGLFNVSESVNRGFTRDRLTSIRFEEGQAIPDGTDDEVISSFLTTRNPRKPLIGNGNLTAERAEALNAKVQQRIADLAIEGELLSIGQNVVNPLRRETWVQKMAVGGAESLGTMAIAASPVGLAALANAYRNDAEEKLIAQGIPLEKAQNLAMVIGPAQGALDRLQLGLLKKMPGLNGLLQKWSTKGAVNFAGRFAGTVAAETGIELAQDQLVPAVVQDVASWWDSEIPGVRWEDVKDEAWNQAPDVFFAVLPLALIGSGAATYRDFKNFRELARDPERLTLAGYSPAQIVAIQMAETDKEAAALVREGWATRKPVSVSNKTETETETTISGTGTGAQGEPATGRDALHATLGTGITEQEANQEAGITALRRDDDGWHVEMEDGARVAVGTLEAARHMRETLLRARTEREADAMVAIADEIAAGFAAEGKRSSQTFTGDKVETRDGQTTRTTPQGKTEAVTFSTSSAAELDRELRTLGATGGLIQGSNWIAEDGTQMMQTNQTVDGAMTMAHEMIERRLRPIMEADNGAMVVAAARVLARTGLFDPAKQRDAEAANFAQRVQNIAADKTNETEARETITEAIVANWASRRKNGKNFAAGSVSAALDEAVRANTSPADVKAIGWMRSMLKAVRAYLRGIFGLAAKLQKARREGKLKDGDDFSALADRIMGLEPQRRHNEAVTKEVAKDEAFSLKGDMSKAPGAAQQDSTPPGGLSEADAIDVRGGTIGLRYEHRRPVTVIATHGTDRASLQFTDPSSGDTNFTSAAAIWFGDDETAATYGKHLIPARITFRKPYVVDYFEHLYGSQAEVGDERLKYDEESLSEILGLSDEDGDNVDVRVAELKRKGFDGFIVTGIDDRQMSGDVSSEPRVIYGVFSRSQIEPIQQKSPDAEGSVSRDSADAGKSNFNGAASGLTENGTTGAAVNEQSPAPADGAESFSLASAGYLDALANRLENTKLPPKKRLQMYQQQADTIRGMARAMQANDATAAATSAAAINRERIKRRKERETELLDAVDKDFGDLSGVEFIASAMNQPVIAAIMRQKPGDPFPRSDIRSRSNAEAAGRDVGGSYDGSQELPRWIFGGKESPDNVAQELYNAGLLKEPSTDALWNEIEKALKATGAAKARLSQYAQRRAEARTQAKEEARAWAEEQTEALPAENKKAERKEMLRSLAVLDAILMKLPAEIRGKVGGFVKLASLQTDAARARFLEKRVAKMDKVLEDFLQEEYRDKLNDLIEKGQPDAKAGEKAKGKIGAEAHRFFATVKEYAALSEKEVEKKQRDLEDELTRERADDEAPLTDGQAAKIFEQQQILDTFGNLEGKNAQELEKAFELATEVYEKERNKWRIQEEQRLAEVAKWAETVPGTANYSGTQRQKKLAKRASEKAKGMLRELSNFSGFIRAMLGEDHPLANRWVDAVRKAREQTENDRRTLAQEWRQAMEEATSKKGREARLEVWKMTEKQTLEIHLAGQAKTKTQAVPAEVLERIMDGKVKPSDVGLTQEEFESLLELSPGEPLEISRTSRGASETVPMTEAEGVFITMLAAQEQYQQGLDAAGFDAEALKEIEDSLSPAAKKLRTWMQKKYAEGYGELNSVFRRMFGVNLAQIENYAPAAFYHSGTDTVRGPGETLPEGGFRSNFLKTRKRHTAAPRIEDAFATFFGHQAQKSHWRAFAEVVREMRGVISKPDVKRALIGEQGQESYNLLVKWINGFEQNGIAQDRSIWDGVTRWLLRQSAFVHLAYNASTLGVQSTAGLGALFKIPAGSYFRGMGRLMARKLDVSRMWKSPLIQNRIENGYAPEVRAALNDMWTAKPSRRQDFLERGLKLNGWMDAVFTTASAAVAWDHHYTEARKTMPEEQARAIADHRTANTIKDTAQPVTFEEKSMFENSLGGLGKLAFFFASDARQKSAILLKAWGNTLTGKPTKMDFQVLIVAHLILGPLIQVIRNAFYDARDNDGDDEDDKWYWPWDAKHWGDGWITAMLLGPLNGVPLLKDVISGLSGFSSNNAAVGRFGGAIQAAGDIAEGAPKKSPDKSEWYWEKAVKVLRGLDATTAVGTNIADQVFDVGENLTQNDDKGSGKRR